MPTATSDMIWTLYQEFSDFYLHSMITPNSLHIVITTHSSDIKVMQGNVPIDYSKMSQCNEFISYWEFYSNLIM